MEKFLVPALLLAAFSFFACDDDNNDDKKAECTAQDLKTCVDDSNIKYCLNGKWNTSPCPNGCDKTKNACFANDDSKPIDQPVPADIPKTCQKGVSPQGRRILKKCLFFLGKMCFISSRGTMEGVQRRWHYGKINAGSATWK